MSNGFAELPLQRKVSVTLLMTIAVFTAISFAILKSVITPAFTNLELTAARTDLVRAKQAIRTDIENLAAVTADWAPWDDMYKYVTVGNPGFAKSNLERPTLDNLGLDMLAVYAVDGDLRWSQLLYDDEDRPLSDLGILEPGQSGFNYLSGHDAATDETVGVVNTLLGPMIICSLPILRSDDTGPVAGAVVMAQFLDEARLARLRERTEVKMNWMLVDETDRRIAENVESLVDGEIHIESGETAISSEMMLFDIFGEPVLVLEAETPRSITALGERTVTIAMAFLLSAGALAMIVVWFLLRGTILKPIESLAGHMEKIRASGDLSHKVDLERNDEIGALAAQFNNLTSEVHEARKALLFQSFKAGKADTAAEVLHNIRNAMTPMINGVERLKKAFHMTDDLRVTEATAQLRADDCSADRKEKLVDYVDASFDHVKAVCDEASEDMQIVISQARQVEGILTNQEKFTNAAPVEEDIVIDEVVGEAAHVIPKDKKAEIEVDIDQDLMQFRVRAHRIGLLQVLGNLILNAYESIERAMPSKGHIQLRAEDTVLDDKPMIRLTVRDNGTGFDEETSKQIFQRGYSSKERGDTSGLGLHWCANAVAGMGGRIFAESPGAGLGAEFHVLLPAAQGG